MELNCKNHPCDDNAVEVRFLMVFKVAICYLTLLSIWARDVKGFRDFYLFF